MLHLSEPPSVRIRRPSTRCAWGNFLWIWIWIAPKRTDDDINNSLAINWSQKFGWRFDEALYNTIISNWARWIGVLVVGSTKHGLFAGCATISIQADTFCRWQYLILEVPLYAALLRSLKILAVMRIYLVVAVPSMQHVSSGIGSELFGVASRRGVDFAIELCTSQVHSTQVS